MLSAVCAPPDWAALVIFWEMADVGVNSIARAEQNNTEQTQPSLGEKIHLSSSNSCGPSRRYLTVIADSRERQAAQQLLVLFFSGKLVLCGNSFSVTC